MLGRRLQMVFCLMAIAAVGRHAVSGRASAELPGLTVREEASRVVFSWTGPVVPPMRDQFTAALAKYGADSRTFLVTLDSPGGSVAEGHGVMKAVRSAAEWHRIDTRVEKGAMCASMCVPLFLLGTERTADPRARFMFHEARIVLPAKPGEEQASFANPQYRHAAETMVTNNLFEADIGAARVSSTWLRRMRAHVVGHDVWASAEQLVDEGSGVVDALVPTGAK